MNARRRLFNGSLEDPKHGPYMCHEPHATSRLLGLASVLPGLGYVRFNPVPPNLRGKSMKAFET